MGPHDKQIQVLKEAEAAAVRHRKDAKDGKWLEELVTENGAKILAWGLEEVWPWEQWPNRVKVFGPNSSPEDNGIDHVGQREDGGLVAIQCKGRRKKKQSGAGNLTQEDINKFASSTTGDQWAERWVVTNAGVGRKLQQRMIVLPGGGHTLKHILIEEALAGEIARREKDANDPRGSMQDDAVSKTLQRLDEVRATAKKAHEGWKPGESRARVIMPCGTGKTRVAYEISRGVTNNGLCVVLAPSIGLVRQLRIAWLDWAERTGEKLATLSVCSDRSVADARQRVEREEELASLDEVDRLFKGDIDDDRGLVDANEITGDVRKHAAEIGEWLKQPVAKGARRVVFCTYQSGHELAEALRTSGKKPALMVCDEAHRTSAIRKTTSIKVKRKIKRFTLCHDGEAFPAWNRVYMTATPKVFDMGEARKLKLTVSSMDDESIFGVLGFRLSYRKAVEMGFLTDYRIVAVALTAEAHQVANEAAMRNAEHLKAEGNDENARRCSASLALRKLAYGLAIAGGIPDPDGEGVLRIASSIAFCNRVDHSKDLARELSEPAMQEKLGELLKRKGEEQLFSIEHRDAGSNANEREQAMLRLARGTQQQGHAITNVGIFGEGIDTPTLDAVAFIEPKRSATDAIQAVGRAMRLSIGKQLGYVIVALEIPPGIHAEAWLESRKNLEGWQELGQILKALQRHDGRIEYDLKRMLHLVAPTEPEVADHVVVLQTKQGEAKPYVWTGETGGLEYALTEQKGSIKQRLEEAGCLRPIMEETALQAPPCATYGVDARTTADIRLMPVDATYSVTEKGYKLAQGVEETRRELKEEIRAKGKKTTKLRKPKKRKAKKKDTKENRQSGLRLVHAVQADGVQPEAIRLNLLEQSGLMAGPKRDFNVLRETVEKAAILLREDGLETELREQLRMEREEKKGNSAADGCTVGALMLTTAAVMHARLEEGGALQGKGVEKLTDIGAGGEPAEKLLEAWNEILSTDYEPVFKIARNMIVRITRRLRRTVGIDAAIRGIVTDAVEIADSYANMGMDHAGELFNEVMGDQASDGAYFTKPVAAMMLGELMAEALEVEDWTTKRAWDKAACFDPTCGSGTLLVAFGQALKRRARAQGAGRRTLQKMHKHLVEHVLMGMDINPVSLQLAGAQLTLGDTAVRYQRMNLWRMPYGYSNGDNSDAPATAGTLELLADERVVGKPHKATQADWVTRTYKTAEKAVRIAVREEEPCEQGGMVDDIVDKVVGRKAVMMNPPFVTRDKLGNRFEEEKQTAIRRRIDGAQELLIAGNPEMEGICDRTTTRPLYVGLALKCIDEEAGVLGTVMPTVGLTAPSGQREREILAEALHIRWVVTCHEPGNVNISQRTSANESLIVGRRWGDNKEEPTRFISLDKLPRNQEEALACSERVVRGEVPNGGHIREVSAERMRRGEWSAARWRENSLDEALEAMASWPELVAIENIQGVTMRAPGDGSYTNAPGEGARRPLLNQKGGQGQKTLEGHPDSMMRLKARRGTTEEARQRHEDKLWAKQVEKYGAHLFLSTGHNPMSGCLMAVTCIEKSVGMRWKPVQGITLEEAKAVSVWMNSSLGRLQMMAVLGGKALIWPTWQPEGLKTMRVPNPARKVIIRHLARVFDETSQRKVPRYDEGYGKLRQRWDRAVWETIGSAGQRDVLEWGNRLDREPVVNPRRFWESA